MYQIVCKTENISLSLRKILLNGAVAAESQKEKVEVNKGFFARIIAFFKMLFGLLPVIVQ